MTIVSGSLPPITLAKPHEGYIPHTYVAIMRSQHCLCCHHYSEWSECYSKTHIRSTTETSWGRKFGTFLRKLDVFMYRLPLEQQRGTHEEILFCAKCYKPSLEHNYELQEPPKADVIPGPGNLGGKASSAAAVAVAKGSSKVATLDKLLDMMS